MLRLLPLASSSKGNSTYIGTETAGILIDAGLGPRVFQGAMSLGGVDDLLAIQAVFITHEHSDHIKGLLKLTERLDIPVYGSRETLVDLVQRDLVCPRTKLFEINRKTVEAAGMEVRAFTTSHDSLHSLGFRITLPNGKTMAFCTDLGTVTPEVHSALFGCDTVMLESNYDKEMLRCGSYPAYLKMRIASQNGHLSNHDCAEELVTLALGGTSQFVIGHLSEENNRPELAAETSIAALTEAGLNIEKDYTFFTAPRTTVGRSVEL